MSGPLAAVRALVAGRVQGVGFRWATRAEAERLGLCGWVRNLADGRVEACAQGDPAAVEAFVSWLHLGPPGASVTSVEVQPAPADHSLDIDSFGILG